MLCATHCRCPFLRRKAMSVRTREDCRDGVTWASETAAKMAERMMALKEDGSVDPEGLRGYSTGELSEAAAGILPNWNLLTLRPAGRGACACGGVRDLAYTEIESRPALS